MIYKTNNKIEKMGRKGRWICVETFQDTRDKNGSKNILYQKIITCYFILCVIYIITKY